MSEFDRANFLLGKQLMYFERYGKLFLADAPILADRDVRRGAPRRAGGAATRRRLSRGHRRAAR